MKKCIYILILTFFLANTVRAQLQYDQSRETWSIVMPEAEAKDVNIGEVLADYSRDSLVTGLLTNTGKYPFYIDTVFIQGLESRFFEVTSGAGRQYLDSGQAADMEFRFSPEEYGNVSSELVIVTQFDTIVRRIEGTGIRPRLQLMTDNIDFGAVDLGQEKDSNGIEILRNISTTKQLVITKIEHSYPNDLDFITTTETENITLQPKELLSVNLKYKPSGAGKTSGTLLIHYDNPSSPALIQLLGEGINNGPDITSSKPTFPEIICESSSTAHIAISNNGGADLQISDIELSGDNSEDFTVNATCPIIIEPDQSRDIEIVFNPQSPGAKSANLTFHSNDTDNPELSTNISAVKHSVIIKPNNDLIDLGNICQASQNSATISISNLGTIASEAYFQFSENLSSAINSISLIENESRDIEIFLDAPQNPGPISEKLQIIDSICGHIYELEIVGQVIHAEIMAADLEITAFGGQSSEAALTVTNISDIEVSIVKIQDIAPPFSVKAGQLPLTIQPQAQADIAIVYTPEDNAPAVRQISIIASPCDISATANLSGHTAMATASLKMNDFEGCPGEYVQTKIILTDETNLSESGAESFSADLHFNHNMLKALNYEQKASGQASSYIEIKDIPLNTEAGSELATVRFEALESSESSCNIELASINFSTGNVSAVSAPGIFTLLSDSSKTGSGIRFYPISPNPVSQTLTIDFYLIEKGKTGFVITDTQGRTVKSIPFPGIPGANRIIIDISDLALGRYFVQLRTPSWRETQVVEVGG